MTPKRDSEPTVHAVRSALRAELTAAIKARDNDAASALRVALAAIDNAEAVPSEMHIRRDSGGHIAHAGDGVGATEVARRELSPAEVAAILRRQVDEYAMQADHYTSLNQHAAAARFRRQSALLRSHTAP